MDSLVEGLISQDLIQRKNEERQEIQEKK